MITKQKYLFYVQGMHCKACKMLIEDELQADVRIVRGVVHLKKGIVEVEGDFGTLSPEGVATELTTLLAPLGYTVSLEKKVPEKKWNDLVLTFVFAFCFVVFFVLLQKLGIVNLIHANNVSFGVAFGVGVVASLSTCMAVVGGLLLSLSATYAQKGEGVVPQGMFHVGRLISFFVLGGIMGLLGAVFTLSATTMFVLSLFVGVVMVGLGLNLLAVFPHTKSLSLPMQGAGVAKQFSAHTSMIAPLLTGVATFFLPCGFTQSMQLYALTTGSFWKGGFTMLAFALGTLPVLACISFGSLALSPKTKNLFFKTAGWVVIAFALFNIANALVSFGIIRPFFSL